MRTTGLTHLEEQCENETAPLSAFTFLFKQELKEAVLSAESLGSEQTGLPAALAFIQPRERDAREAFIEYGPTCSPLLPEALMKKHCLVPWVKHAVLQ